MKMTKKILTVAVVAAALFGLAGCNPEIGDIDWKNKGSGDGNQTYTVNQKNEAGSTIRGMKKVGLMQRAQGTCVVRQYDQDTNSCDGMVGFVACLTKNKTAGVKEDPKPNDGTYNFLVVGVRNNKGVTETYASFFYNIAEDKMSTENFGVGKNTKEEYDPKATEPYEVELLKFPSILSGVKFDADGTLAVAIKMTEYDDGDIEIQWSNDFVENHAAASCTINSYKKVITVDAGKVGRSATSPKGSLNTYANIYTGKTLHGQWDIYDVSWAKESLAADDDTFDGFGDILFEEVK